MASCSCCFPFKVSPAVAASTFQEAGPPHRHLSSLLQPNAAATFHKVPTLRTAGRRLPNEAAPFIWRSFWPRPAAEDDDVSEKDGGASEEPKSLLGKLAAESPVGKLMEKGVSVSPAAKLVEQTVLESPVAKLVEEVVSESPAEKLVEKTVLESPVVKLVEKVVSESPVTKLVENAVSESPAAKLVEEVVLEPPVAKIMEEAVLESPVTKLVEEAVLESSAAKLVEEIVLESSAAKLVEEVEAVTESALLKIKLLELLKGTDRGILASSEVAAETLELISRLEALNPTPAPTDDLALDGKWILAYWSSLRLPQTLQLLLSALPVHLVKMGEISQDIDAKSSTLQNSVKILLGPIAAASLGTTAKFEVQSPKRVLITCTEGLIGAPHFAYHAALPGMSQIKELLGQHIDLSPFERALSSLQEWKEPLKGVMNSIKDAEAPLKSGEKSMEEAAAPLQTLMSSIEEAAAPVKAVGSSIQDTAASVGKAIADGVKIPIPNPGTAASFWLLTTYLDEGMRISRGEDGSVFVLVKAAP